MSLNSLKRASNIEISSQLTGDVSIDTPQKVNIDALKLKMIQLEKKDNFNNYELVPPPICDLSFESIELHQKILHEQNKVFYK